MNKNTKKNILIGENLRRRRIELNLSSKEVADSLKISLSAYNHYEIGIRNLLSTRIAELSIILKMPVENILRGIPIYTEILNKQQEEVLANLTEINNTINKLIFQKQELENNLKVKK